MTKPSETEIEDLAWKIAPWAFAADPADGEAGRQRGYARYLAAEALAKLPAPSPEER